MILDVLLWLPIRVTKYVLDPVVEMLDAIARNTEAHIDEQIQKQEL